LKSRRQRLFLLTLFHPQKRREKGKRLAAEVLGFLPQFDRRRRGRNVDYSAINKRCKQAREMGKGKMLGVLGKGGPLPTLLTLGIEGGLAIVS